MKALIVAALMLALSASLAAQQPAPILTDAAIQLAIKETAAKVAQIAQDVTEVKADVQELKSHAGTIMKIAAVAGMVLAAGYTAYRMGQTHPQTAAQ